MDGAFDVREDPGLQVIVEILDIGDRFIFCKEVPVLFGEGDCFYPFYDICTDQVAAIGRLHMRDPEQVSGFVQRFPGQFRETGPAFYRETDRMFSARVTHCREQEFSGGPVDREFCPAVRVGDNLKERYDNFFCASLVFSVSMVTPCI